MSIIPYLLANIKFEDALDASREDIQDGVIMLDSELEETHTPLPLSKTPSEMAKDMIERRYRRLSTSNRRPSLEYISSEDILTIFLKFVENKDTLLKMSQQDLQDLYDTWYSEIYQPSLRGTGKTGRTGGTGEK
jgi:hypothetical protein